MLGVQRDESLSLWEVEVEGKGAFTGKYVINASGPLSPPSHPISRVKIALRASHSIPITGVMIYDYKGKRVATGGVISYPVIGKQGAALADFWSDYPRAYLGTSIPRFPNLFIVTGPNAGIGHTSAIFIIEAQMQCIMRCSKLYGSLVVVIVGIKVPVVKWLLCPQALVLAIEGWPAVLS